jgi:hypothetical protein
MTNYHAIEDNIDIHTLINSENSDVISCRMREIQSIKPYDFTILKFEDNHEIEKIINKLITEKLKMKNKLSNLQNNVKINYLSNKESGSGSGSGSSKFHGI